MTTIDINLQPTAWAYLNRIGESDGLAVAIPNSHRHLYQMITANLEHRKIISAGAFKRYCSKMVPGKIYIEDYDATRFGTNIRYERQAIISRFIYNSEKQRLCELIANAHLRYGVAISAAAKYYIDKFYLDCDEINFELIKKHYQRHRNEFENDIITDLQFFNSHKTTQK